jgi:RNA polymerase sigma-70 factor (ECF subfamily)
VREEAFLEIYREHSAPLFRFVWRMSGSGEIAEDVTQECFLALAKGAAFDGRKGSLRTYLFGMARNLVFRRLRISTRETAEQAEVADPSDTLDELLAMERCEICRKPSRGCHRFSARQFCFLSTRKWTWKVLPR